MTIQKAIKSGKPFRRTGQWWWFKIKSNGDIQTNEKYPITLPANIQDILADDWEVKDEETIKKSKNDGLGVVFQKARELAAEKMGTIKRRINNDQR